MENRQPAPTPAGIPERELVARLDRVKPLGGHRHRRKITSRDLDELFGCRIDGEAYSHRAFDPAEFVSSRSCPHHLDPGRKWSSAKLRSGEIDRHSHVLPGNVGGPSERCRSSGANTPTRHGQC